MASTDDEHPHRYNAQLANAVETRWQKHWAEQGTFTMGNPGDAGFDATRPFPHTPEFDRANYRSVSLDEWRIDLPEIKAPE